MINAKQAAKAWKFLMACTEKVKDPVLASAMREEFRQRALREWGWCPEKTEEQVLLDEWEEQFTKDIKDTIDYDVDVREKQREQEIKETKARMYMMIEEGKTYWDIPQEIQSDFLRKLWIEVENVWLANNLENVKISAQGARK